MAPLAIARAVARLGSGSEPRVDFVPWPAPEGPPARASPAAAGALPDAAVAIPRASPAQLAFAWD
jgi:hypothetical protein